MFRQTVRTAIAIAGFTAAAAMAQTTTTATRSSTTPPIGLGSSETAQINVVNLASASSSGTAASCTGTISFVNASGTVIGSAASFTAASGQIVSVTLPFTKIGSTAVRTEIRGVIAVTVGSAPCALESSLETFDTATGATHVFVVNAAGGGPFDGGGPGRGR